MKRGVGLLLCVAVTASLASASAGNAGTLRTSFIDPWSFDPQLSGSFEASVAGFVRARDAGGARSARLGLLWRVVAPFGSTKPLDFDARDPADQLYQWSAFDQQIKAAAAAGIDDPLVFVELAPDWAENNGNGPSGRPSEAGLGRWKPSPTEFGAFAEAAAKRYSGTFCDPADPSCSPPCDAAAGEVCLPRVRLWQALNEPNRSSNLYPQYVDGKLFSPRWYRAMVNHFAAGVHTVGGNLVVAGGQAPHKHSPSGSPAPMPFMRSMLCMSKSPYRSICNQTAAFDVWSHHPYACGGPNREAFSAEDIQLADLPEMRALLSAAVRARHVQSSSNVKFWVTELAWTTRPPSDGGVPLRLHARWVAEALYRSARAGVSYVAWFLLVDRPPDSIWQTGLFYDTLQPKTGSLRAFRFPFVAYVRSGRVFTWGRIPPDAPAQYVVVQRRTSSGAWRMVGRVWAARPEATFSKTFATSRSGVLRATVKLNDGSTLIGQPFSLKRPNDPYICPFA